MIFKCSILFLGALISVSEAAYVETLQKCSTSDKTCFINLIEKVFKDLSNGIDELNIKPIDPIRIENKSANVLDLVNITVVEGIVTGAKDCKVNNFQVILEKDEINIDATCDLKFKGRYVANGEGDIIKNLFGGQNIHGNGNAEIELDKLNIKLKLFYDGIKKEDGEIYVKILPKKTIAEYDVAGLKMSVDNIFLGDQDASQLINGYINQNFKTILPTNLGKHIFNAGMDIVHEILNAFFFNVPVKYYISDDISQYVKN